MYVAHLYSCFQLLLSLQCRFLGHHRRIQLVPEYFYGLLCTQAHLSTLFSASDYAFMLSWNPDLAIMHTGLPCGATTLLYTQQEVPLDHRRDSDTSEVASFDMQSANWLSAASLPAARSSICSLSLSMQSSCKLSNFSLMALTIPKASHTMCWTALLATSTTRLMGVSRQLYHSAPHSS